ncbi:MAG: hypothetical protein AB8V06_07290 [Francisella endosymbiont of Hyalomma asiaticum]
MKVVNILLHLIVIFYIRYFYQLSNYDVTILTSKYLGKIDQDCSIIAANIDGTAIPSKIYVNQAIYIEYNLENEPKNVF